MKKRHIFIQCASYRDPELRSTIISAFENANQPDKVYFGICHQGKVEGLKRDLPPKNINQCRTVFIPMYASKGIGYARNKAQLMFEDEEYTLQIDSHMKFLPGWDDMCIKMLESCPSRKPLLTAYFTDHAVEEDPGCWRLCAEKFNQTGNIVIMGARIIKAPKVQLGILASAHFVFVRSELFKEVPVDPNMQFLYEETLIAPRAFTNGWDIFYPHKAPLQHKWNRSYRKTFWNDLDTSERELQCQALFQQIVGITPGFHDLGQYGMGKIRSFEEYQDFSGINFKEQTLTQKAKSGLPNL